MRVCLFRGSQGQLDFRPLNGIPMGRTGVRFHAFRRFRESVLLASDARPILIDYWMGHENPAMSTRYGKQLVEEVNYRKQSAEKVGLGFRLPQVSELELGVSCATCYKFCRASLQRRCVSRREENERSDHPFTQRSGDMVYTSLLD